ncbi:hypothetical protein C0J52_15822 [Blattella germanica]|nr:hypothetical protein C0J52_15822 [Blattella germanica]
MPVRSWTKLRQCGKRGRNMVTGGQGGFLGVKKRLLQTSTRGGHPVEKQPSEKKEQTLAYIAEIIRYMAKNM